MIACKWMPIQRLAISGEEYDFSEINSLHRQWLNVRNQREASRPEIFDGFIARLSRSWAIETGIIEGIYTLDRGITETLVERGISADLIESGSTNKDPQELVQILRDHQEAAGGVYQEIREGRPLSRSAIRQIHSVLTRNQPTYGAVDQFGRRFNATLHHGAFKLLPNNPTRVDEYTHEYCPPEHVDSELDNLLKWCAEYQQDIDSYHPLLTAAWLHHRFTQIHPFEDGNGRVARTLLTWHLVKENYLPVVIKRDDREQYIDALEFADRGDLRPFVDLLIRLQKQTILEALGEQEEVEQAGLVDQVLDHIVEQIRRQNQDRETQLRSVDDVARVIQAKADSFLSSQADRIKEGLNAVGRNVTYFIDRGGPGEKEHWYRSQVVQTANNARHWVNFNEARFFVKLSITPDNEETQASRYPRLIFVISLHHTGRQLTGIMAATGFALIGHSADPAIEQSEQAADFSFEDCTLEPYTLTSSDDAEAISPRFLKWTEQSLSIALRKWGEYLA